jgi:hypothetical protein
MPPGLAAAEIGFCDQSHLSRHFTPEGLRREWLVRRDGHWGTDLAVMACWGSIGGA